MDESELNVMTEWKMLDHSIWLGLQAHKISVSASLVNEDLDPLELMGFKNDCEFQRFIHNPMIICDPYLSITMLLAYYSTIT